MTLPTPRALTCGLLLALLLPLTAASGDPAAEPAQRQTRIPAFAFEEADIAQLQQRMASGRLSSRALVDAYLRRIAAIDDAGPRLNAVIELNPDARSEADALDAERRAGRLRGPLHGIPVLIKDNIDAVPMVNSGGSLALASNRPARDAFLVARLRAAGAVILGKTNLSEWANFRSTRSTSGWSARGGQTRNPHALDRSPCGSSSGSGAAVSANLAVAAVGTETDGSILCPSAVNGLVGIKPTVGLISRSGIIPISASQDTAGPMARSVADAAALLTAMAASDPDDPATVAGRGPAQDYLAALDPQALKGARIGVLRKSTGYHPGLDAQFERALTTLRNAGAVLVDAEIATDGQWRQAEYAVLLHEFRDAIDRYLAGSGAPVSSLEALIAYNRTHADTQMPWFGQEIFEMAQATGPIDAPAYLEARATARRLAGTEGIDATLSRHSLVALVAPTTGPAWVIDPINGDHFPGAGYGAAAVAGTPSITVPMGEVHGLPVGLVLLGPAWSETRLIGLAHAFEQASRARKPPRFLPTVATPDGR